MNKKWLIGIALVLVLGLVHALTQFNDTVEVWSSSARGFVVVENFLSPKDHFRVDTNPGGRVYSTSIEPIGAPNPSLGSSANPWSGGIYGQTISVIADAITTCNAGCDSIDGRPIGSYNWTCSYATLTNGSAQLCTDTGRQRNCICKN